MSGALAERDFVEKLRRAGFIDIEIVHRELFGVDEAELYPLFTGDLIEVMRKVIPTDKQDEVATSVVVKARLRAGSQLDIPRP